MPSRSSGPSAGSSLPAVIGHRGAAAYAPENTLAGFRRARALGCSWVEFDVRLTADGALVLCHDALLDRTTDGAGRVSALTLAAIGARDAGSWFGPDFIGERVPTLEQALTLAAELSLGANIEIKAERGREYATGAAVAAILRRLDGRLPGVLVSSFQPWALDPPHKLAPSVPRGILFRLVPRDWAVHAERFGCAVIGADHRRLAPRRIAAIRAAGYQLAAFTVNSPARARRLFDWGVTSVFSDAPDIVSMVNAGRRPVRWAKAALHDQSAAREGALR